MKYDALVTNALNTTITALSTAPADQWADGRVIGVAATAFLMGCLSNLITTREAAARDEIVKELKQGITSIEDKLNLPDELKKYWTPEFKGKLLLNLDQIALRLEEHDGKIESMHASLTDVTTRLGTIESFISEYLPEYAHPHSQLTSIAKQVDDILIFAFRTSYLNNLLTTAGRIDLIGIDRKTAEEEDARGAEVQLGAIYVPLNASELEEEEKSKFNSRTITHQSPTEKKNIERKAIPAVAQLDRHPRLVLLSDPGGGKSTFVKFVISCLTGAALGNQQVNLTTLVTPVPIEHHRNDEKVSLDTWSHGTSLPVMVELRKFAATGLPTVGDTATGDHLWQFIASEVVNMGLVEYPAFLLRELMITGGIIFLDGLDEVPEADQRRKQIIDAIEGFAATFQNCRILVTSRTYAYLNQSWRLHGFHEAKLLPFTRPQIDAFIDRWYVQATITRRRTEADALDRGTRLKNEIVRNTRLYDLAQRPLILTLMAALHDWRGGELPAKRHQLYEEAVDLLLERWNKKKTYRDGHGHIVALPNLAEWLQVDRTNVRQLLNRLAYEAHAAQPGLTGTADIGEDKLVVGLFDIKNGAFIDQRQIINYLQERAGLIVAHGTGVYTFLHRSLQEYLAACYMADRDDPDALAEIVLSEPNRWREVALLAGAIKGVWSLADALCPDTVDTYPCGKEPRDAWGALIGGLGIAENGQLPPATRRNVNILSRLQSHLACILTKGALPAIERAVAGDVLATIGDPRFHSTDLWCLPMDDNLGFIEIPAGEFPMGGDCFDAAPVGLQMSKSQHPISLPTYYIAKFPVTVTQFRTFVESTNYQLKYDKCLQGKANHPIASVSWHDATAYCSWLTTQLQHYRGFRLLSKGRGFKVTLPSEAEWEKVARWGNVISDLRIYPWAGDEIDTNLANCRATGINSTSAVGCFPAGASIYGVQDMIGNVWEWTRSNSQEYPYVHDNGLEKSDGIGYYVSRGGSWEYISDYDFSSHRLISISDNINDYIGFRCALTLSEP
ncbi:MAG: SUMF1/EgtB/PvdO family nonheme iron enzyme [bacterium]